MKKKLIFAAILIVFVVAIILFFVFREASVSYESYFYNSDFEFVKYEDETGNITHTLLLSAGFKNNLELYQIPFRYSPYELEGISVEKGIRDKMLASKGFYITLDPDYDVKSVIAAVELSKILSTADFSIFKFPIDSAFTKEREGYDTPVKDCKDATSDIKIIKLLLGSSTKVYSQDNCIIVEGNTYDNLIKSAESLSLTLLTVFP